MRALCRACGAPIFFVRAATGNRKPMPLDVKPNRAGNVTLGRDESGEQIAWVTSGPPPSVFPPEPVYMPHFATCPHAASFRKGKRP